MGFTDMDHEGMLIEGFDQIGTMATIYNYPYYPKQVERIGYGKDQDWHEFKIYIPDGVPEKHLRIGEIVKKKYGLKVLKFKNAKEIMPYAPSYQSHGSRCVRKPKNPLFILLQEVKSLLTGS